jgi:heat shock protein HslJ
MLAAWAGVVSASAGCLTLYGFLGFNGTAYDIWGATFLGACNRLKAAHLPILASDWFCHPSQVLAQASLNSVESSILYAAGFVIAGVTLAASGRRSSALLPILAPMALTSGWISYVLVLGQPSLLARQPLLAGFVALALLCAPVLLAVMLLSAGRLHRPISLRGGLLSAAMLGATWALLYHFRVAEGWLTSGWLDNWEPAVVIVFFGALLGTDRKWWPWSLALVSLLLSQGPSLAATKSFDVRATVLFGFGVVLPLFFLGLVASCWQPLALWLDLRLGWRREPSRISDAARVVTPQVRKLRVPVRPTAVLNALAVSVIAISLIASRNDPMLVWNSTSLPTFTGESVMAQDSRTKLDLFEAIAAADSFRTKTGSYRGFNASVGAGIDPTLAWTDAVAPVRTLAFLPVLPTEKVGTLPSSANRVRLVSVSPSGTYFCMQRQGSGPITYGVGDASSGNSSVARMNQALATCSDIRWGPSSAPNPARAMSCDPSTFGYMLCRLVQANIQQVMLAPNPENPVTQGATYPNFGPTPPPTLSSLMGKWIATSIDGGPVGPAAPTLDLEASQMILSDGCNGSFIKYRLQGDELVPYGSWASTAMGCGPPGQQQAFMDVAAVTSTLRFQGAELILSGPKGDVTLMRSTHTPTPSSVPTP